MNWKEKLAALKERYPEKYDETKRMSKRHFTREMLEKAVGTPAFGLDEAVIAAGIEEFFTNKETIRRRRTNG